MKIALPAPPRAKPMRSLKKARKEDFAEDVGYDAEDVKAWAVVFLPGGVVASGDSAGRVCFWDAHFGTLLFDFRKHQADVTTMVATDDGTGLFASGLDVRIAVFQNINMKGMICPVLYCVVLFLFSKFIFHWFLWYMIDDTELTSSYTCLDSQRC